MDSSDFLRQILFQPYLVKKNSVCPQDLPRYSHVPSHHIPAMVTEYASVQLLGFDLFGSLTHIFSLHDFCSSGQSFAHWGTFGPLKSDFLQIPSHDGHPGHPCSWLYPSRCRADWGLSPFETCARWAHQKQRQISFQIPAAVCYLPISAPDTPT